MHTVKKTTIVFSDMVTRLCIGNLFALLLISGAYAQKNSQTSKLITQVPFTTFTGGVVILSWIPGAAASLWIPPPVYG